MSSRLQDTDDVKPRFISWAIFEVSWGKTKKRTTDEIDDLTRARMNMTRVCIYHVNQHHIGRAAAMCGEVIATMCWECTRYEVDIRTGDGNKAAYCATPIQVCPQFLAPILDRSNDQYRHSGEDQTLWRFSKDQIQTFYLLFIH